MQGFPEICKDNSVWPPYVGVISSVSMLVQGIGHMEFRGQVRSARLNQHTHLHSPFDVESIQKILVQLLLDSVLEKSTQEQKYSA